MNRRTYGRLSNDQICDVSKYMHLYDKNGYMKKKKESPWQGFLLLCSFVVVIFLLNYVAALYGIN